MINRKKIAVVVPAYNEEKMIGRVVKTMPRFVDQIIIIDDASIDKTVKNAEEAGRRFRQKINIIKFAKNQGVGKAIVEGYKKTIALKMDVVAVMAGDAQMDPAELKDICLPIVHNEADCVKGNRLIYGRAWKMIPSVRYLGNSVLSLLTKVASGYWHVADSQTGYVAISRSILEKMWLDHLYPRYGFPNDLLIHLNIAHARVKEIPIKPIYHLGGKSGIQIWKVIPAISWLLLRRFFWRLKIKYIIEDFHPLVFFYIFSFILGLVGFIFLVRVIYIMMIAKYVPTISSLALIFCVIMATQFLFFAMWFDMDYNKDLKVK